MTMETLQKDLVKYWKAGMVFEKNVLANMTDAIKKATMTPKGRIAITDQLVDETLIKYQKTVQEQYDTCPETDENPERAAELKQRKALYLKELNLVKEYAPQLMTDFDEIKGAVIALLSEYGPVDTLSSKSNRGTVMKIVAPAMKGKADMAVVTQVVNQLLA